MMVNKKSSIRKKSQGDYQKGYVSSAKRGLIEKLFLALVVLMLCACSSDDELESTYNGANATGGVTYLTVNLREVGSATRASDGGYAYGLGTERNIANVYFYFYDNNGNYITRGSVNSNITGSASTHDDTGVTADGNIEWNSNTVVAVYGLEEGNYPTKMVTVVNQPSGFNASHLSFDEMTTKLAGTPYADASGNFVMSTSVYYDGGSGIIYNYTTLNSNNFALEPINVDVDFGTGGSATPVEVYVERLAAKIEVDVAQGLDKPIPITISNAGSESLENGVNVQLLGWDVDGIARDAYMVKQVEGWIANDFGNNWTWQSVSDHRSYWAKSPNYGVAETETVYYPTSSKGYTATEEADSTTGLNKYLRYVDLQSPIALGSATYCGENTNTVGTNGVIQDANSTALTNVLVKAQAQDANGSPIDLVEYDGYYYTVADFCQNYVYKNFASTIGNAIEALESVYPDLTDALSALESAVSAGGSVYKTSISAANPTATTSFGGEMLSLYNAYDGNVTIGYNMDSSTTDNNIVYNGLALDEYNFWFSVDASQLTDDIDALTNAGLLNQIGSTYYIPLTEQNTLLSYFLSALVADATATNNSFATNSSYPNYYNKGMMYYHVPIEHLNTTTGTSLVLGQYGVVRNHWYDISINSIASMGRGIAKEDEVIVPIGNNAIQTNSIGASTKIYSWKEYDQTVIF